MRIYVAKGQINFFGKTSEMQQLNRGVKIMHQYLHLNPHMDSLEQVGSGKIHYRVRYDTKLATVAKVRSTWNDTVVPMLDNNSVEKAYPYYHALEEFAELDEVMEFGMNKKKRIVKAIMENTDMCSTMSTGDYVDMCIQLSEVK